MNGPSAGSALFCAEVDIVGQDRVVVSEFGLVLVVPMAFASAMTCRWSGH